MRKEMQEKHAMRDELIQAWQDWVEARKALGWYAHPFASALDDLIAIANIKEPGAVVAFELHVLKETGELFKIQ